MQLLLILPDWLPNIHPLVIHFPIALLAVAVLGDLIRLVFTESSWLNNSVVAGYILGTIGLIFAFVTGRNAAATVEVTGEAFSVLASHENWALATMIFFLIFTTLRVTAAWVQQDHRRPVLAALFGLGFIGMIMVWITGDRGGELVFRHGTGVEAVEDLQQRLARLEDELEEFRGAASPQVADDGSWIWRIAPGSDRAMREAFQWIAGSVEEAEVNLIRDEEGGQALAVTSHGEALMFVINREIEAVEGRLMINTDDFEGTVALVHNVLDSDTYQYLRLENGMMGQGQLIDGEDDMLGGNTAEASGWKEIRVQAAGGHFYGYLNGDQRVHTHASQMDPGYTGLLIEGSGTLMIQRVSFDSLD